MNIKLRAAIVLATLAFAGAGNATVLDQQTLGKPTATSPPAAHSTWGVAASALDPATTGKPSATSPLTWRSVRELPTRVAETTLAPGAVGKPSATSPPAGVGKERG